MLRGNGGVAGWRPPENRLDNRSDARDDMTARYVRCALYSHRYNDVSHTMPAVKRGYRLRRLGGGPCAQGERQRKARRGRVVELRRLQSLRLAAQHQQDADDVLDVFDAQAQVEWTFLASLYAQTDRV